MNALHVRQHGIHFPFAYLFHQHRTPRSNHLFAVSIKIPGITKLLIRHCCYLVEASHQLSVTGSWIFMLVEGFIQIAAAVLLAMRPQIRTGEQGIRYGFYSCQLYRHFGMPPLIWNLPIRGWNQYAEPYLRLALRSTRRAASLNFSSGATNRQISA